MDCLRGIDVWHKNHGLPGAVSGVNDVELLPGIELPDAYRCPVSLELMEGPVRAPDGYHYESSAIIQWLRGSATSPLTRQTMHLSELQ
ncbi:MAG: hypothetical protein EOO40_01105, partial [Deltaproteobacteria bacterium]